MSSLDILSVAFFIFAYKRFLDPILARLNKKEPNKGLTELQRMGIGLMIAIMAMISAGIVEKYRLKNKEPESFSGSSSLSICWQVPQYMLIGASEVFMYFGQLEFFNSQVPTGAKELCNRAMYGFNISRELCMQFVSSQCHEDIYNR